MECCIRWPGLHNHPTSTQLRWFGMSWNAEWRKSSQHMWELLQGYCQSIPSEAGWDNGKSVQSCHQGKGWLLWRISYKIYLYLFNTFLVTLWFHMCYFIFLMSSLLFYNVEKLCPNFWLVLYVVCVYLCCVVQGAFKIRVQNKKYSKTCIWCAIRHWSETAKNCQRN